MYCAIIDFSAAIRASLEQILPRTVRQTARFSFFELLELCLLSLLELCFLCFLFVFVPSRLFHSSVLFGRLHNLCIPPSMNAPGALKWGHASLMRPRKPLPAGCP